ncbi:MAG TPA: hypothetical protein VHD84_00485 [Candidatus Saccharimonadales bacterium]|nr:hypothetical protein [Candidatus Saccharimonadales bacterium]
MSSQETLTQNSFDFIGRDNEFDWESEFNAALDEQELLIREDPQDVETMQKLANIMDITSEAGKKYEKVRERVVEALGSAGCGGCGVSSNSHAGHTHEAEKKKRLEQKKREEEYRKQLAEREKNRRAEPSLLEFIYSAFGLD